MVKEATETTEKRADIFAKPKPIPRQQVCQAIMMMGSEAAYIKSLQVHSETEANLHIMELAEATGKMLKKSHQNRPGKVKYECNDDCPCKISFSKNTDDPNAAWEHSFTPHGEYGNGAVLKQKKHTMESTSLAPTLYDSLRVNPQLHWKLTRNILSPYLLSLPSHAFIQRTLERARKDLHGNRDDQAALMMAIKAALEKQGHVMNAYEVGKESQKEIIREQHKKDRRKQYLDACKDISHGTPTPVPYGVRY
jgi:hypothetical protein